MNRLIPFVIAFGLATAASVLAKEATTLPVKQGGSEFVTNVGRLCLSKPESKLELVDAGRIRLTEADAACVKDLREFASTWDARGSTEVAAVHAGTDRRKQDIRKQVEAGGAGKVTAQVARGCPCVLLKGTGATAAASKLAGEPAG